MIMKPSHLITLVTFLPIIGVLAMGVTLVHSHIQNPICKEYNLGFIKCTEENICKLSCLDFNMAYYKSYEGNIFSSSECWCIENEKPKQIY